MIWFVEKLYGIQRTNMEVNQPIYWWCNVNIVGYTTNFCFFWLTAVFFGWPPFEQCANLNHCWLLMMIRGYTTWYSIRRNFHDSLCQVVTHYRRWTPPVTSWLKNLVNNSCTFRSCRIIFKCSSSSFFWASCKVCA